MEQEESTAQNDWGVACFTIGFLTLCFLVPFAVVTLLFATIKTALVVGGICFVIVFIVMIALAADLS